MVRTIKGKRPSWTEENMLLAIRAVVNKEMSWREAAFTFHVPETTLRRKATYEHLSNVKKVSQDESLLTICKRGQCELKNNEQIQLPESTRSVDVEKNARKGRPLCARKLQPFPKIRKLSENRSTLSNIQDTECKSYPEMRSVEENDATIQSGCIVQNLIRFDNLEVEKNDTQMIDKNPIEDVNDSVRMNNKCNVPNEDLVSVGINHSQDTIYSNEGESSCGVTALNSNTIKCVFCNQNFSSKLELQDHFRCHAKGEIDIKGWPRGIVLKKHFEQTDEGNAKSLKISSMSKYNEDAVCDVCGDVFESISKAITHKFRKHPNSVLKYYCSHCGMQFPMKGNRDKHMLMHSAAVPKQLLLCIVCQVPFYNEQARKFHANSTHKGVIRLVNPIQTPAPSLKVIVNNAGEVHSVYYCHLCGCEYQIKFNLQKHLTSTHSETELTSMPKEFVQCNLCSSVFYSKKAYETHSFHHRESDLYAANELMRQQVVQRIDQDFDSRRIPNVLDMVLSSL